ncbi:oocyte zinc finger protein XlCOF19-like [Planococcus citri]|uniref:oocyte zinc finger protein XlCOF19-like n=1 Tax=Planococcus citri TaxID=170843 RepID=UPI0031F7A5AE
MQTSLDRNFTAEYEFFNTEQETFQCFHCDENFFAKSTLSKHVQKQHSILKNTTKSCKVCGSAVKPPVNSVNEDLKCESCIKLTPFSCRFCDEKFDQNATLKVHLKSHRNEKPFECDLCKNHFSNLQHLKRHIEVIHNGQTNYQCKFCQKCFRWDSSLRTHLKTHTNERPHQCSSCNFSFRRSCDLKRHMITHTNEKNYSCQHCSKKFTRNSSLQRHVRAHFGDKPYLCSVCGKRFNESFFLKEHMESHSENRLYYHCDLCNKRFNNRRVLRVHAKKHLCRNTNDVDECSNVTKDVFSSYGNQFPNGVTELPHF